MEQEYYIELFSKSTEYKIELIRVFTKNQFSRAKHCFCVCNWSI